MWGGVGWQQKQHKKINKVKVNKMGLNFLFFVVVRTIHHQPLMLLSSYYCKPHCIIMFIISLSLLLCRKCMRVKCNWNCVRVVCDVKKSNILWSHMEKPLPHTHTHIINAKFPNKGRMRIIYAVIKSNQMWNCVCILIDF